MRKLKFLFIVVILLGAVSQSFSQDIFEETRIEYLEFREVDIKDVLRQLAKQYNLNIVFSESVSGRITVQLQNVTIEEALDAIITINGFVYTKKGEVIKVTTPQEAERESKMTKVFRLNNADAKALKDSLKKILSPDGSIEVDARSNALIVTDIPAVMSKIEEMLPALDEITPQVLIETKFVETTVGKTEEIGIEWQTSVSLTGAARRTTLPFGPMESDGHAWEKEVFAPAAPGDTDFVDPYGFPYVNQGSSVESPLSPVSQGIYNYFYFGTLDFSQMQIIMDFLKTDTDTRLVSSPRIVTMDNTQANIYIGKTRPIPQFEFNSDTGEYQITGFEEKIEGVTLTVTPVVNRGEDGVYNIRLKLEPRVTTFIDTVSFTALGFDYPIMSERSTQTEVMIKDGQSIVIGGLIQNQKTEIVKKFPVLGDIPIIGMLFTHREVNPNSQTELLIFVTATVIDRDEGRLLAYKSNLITSPPRPFKLKMREVEAK